MKTIPWCEVEKMWEARERGIWDEHIKQRGYDSWFDYRIKAQPCELATLQWEELTVTDPNLVGTVLCGPFQGWAQYHESGLRESYPFSVIAESPVLAANERVQANQARLEREGVAHAIALSYKNELVLIDGHHTLSAYCLNLKQGKAIRSQLILHVGKIPPHMESTFEKYKRGEIPSRLF